MCCNQCGERTLPLLIQFGGVHPPPPQCHMLSARYLVWKCPRWASRARSACWVKTTEEYFDQKNIPKNYFVFIFSKYLETFVNLQSSYVHSCMGQVKSKRFEQFYMHKVHWKRFFLFPIQTAIVNIKSLRPMSTYWIADNRPLFLP